MTDEKRIDEKVEALSDEELEGASGGKRIEVVTGVKGVIADSDPVAADFGDSLKGSADSLKAGFGANVACTDPRK